MSRTGSSSHTGQARPKRRPAKDHRPRRETATQRPSSGTASSDGWVRHGTALPSWTDLEPPQNRRRKTTDDSFLQRVSTVRFALLVLLVAGAFTLYVGHVHATADLVTELQEVRAENQRLHLKRNRLKGEFDRRTGPAVIYERARELGLRASTSYGPPISLDE